MEYQHIESLSQNNVNFVTIRRPEKRNALNAQLVTELKHALRHAADSDQVKVVVLKAAGKAFCAGADLGYLQDLQRFSEEENLQDSQHLKELFWLVYTLPKPVIAQVQGHAIAGGCGLATVCDFVFSVPEAKFGYTEVKIGFVPAIVMLFLVRKIGEAHARNLLLGGDLISAAKAEQLGMVHQIVPPEQLGQHVKDFAYKLCQQNSGDSMRLTKQMLGKIQEMPLGQALDFAAEQNAAARHTADCKKGIAAFLSKQPVQW